MGYEIGSFADAENIPGDCYHDSGEFREQAIFDYHGGVTLQTWYQQSCGERYRLIAQIPLNGEQVTALRDRLNAARGC